MSYVFRSPRPSRSRRARFLPSVDRMEDRTLLSTLTVSNTLDGGPGSLRGVIAAAASGDTVVFADALQGGTITLTGGELTIDKSIDVEGPGAGRLTVSGGGLGRVFDVATSGVSVTIAGLTITGGRSVYGGAILDQGGALTLSDDVLTGNQAVGVSPGDFPAGGAVVVGSDGSGVAGSLIVVGTTFAANSAVGTPGVEGGSDSQNGSGGPAFGGAIYAEAGTALTVTAGDFVGNQALGGEGSDGGDGGLFSQNGNGGEGDGGAIYFNGPFYTPDGAAPLLDVGDSTFIGNLARGGDGGHGQGGSGTVNGQGGDAYGGGLYFIGAGSFRIHGSTFARNAALGGRTVGVAGCARRIRQGELRQEQGNEQHEEADGRKTPLPHARLFPGPHHHACPFCEGRTPCEAGFAAVQMVRQEPLTARRVKFRASTPA